MKAETEELGWSEGPWGREGRPLEWQRVMPPVAWDTEPMNTDSRTHNGRMQTEGTRGHAGSGLSPRNRRKAPFAGQPWSRTGENPPYGILGGTMETSASFEARSAPSPTRPDSELARARRIRQDRSLRILGGIRLITRFAAERKDRRPKTQARKETE